MTVDLPVPDMPVSTRITPAEYPGRSEARPDSGRRRRTPGELSADLSTTGLGGSVAEFDPT